MEVHFQKGSLGRRPQRASLVRVHLLQRGYLSCCLHAIMKIRAGENNGILGSPIYQRRAMALRALVALCVIVMHMGSFETERKSFLRR